MTDEFTSISGITVRKVQIRHGLRRWVEHVGYEVRVGGGVVYHLGDGTLPILPKGIDRLRQEIRKRPDVALVTIGGLDANVTNAVRLVKEFRPKTVIPMHWQLVTRRQKRGERFCRRVYRETEGVNCRVPSPLNTISIPWCQEV